MKITFQLSSKIKSSFAILLFLTFNGYCAEQVGPAKTAYILTYPGFKKTFDWWLSQSWKATGNPWYTRITTEECSIDDVRFPCPTISYPDRFSWWFRAETGGDYCHSTFVPSSPPPVNNGFYYYGVNPDTCWLVSAPLAVRIASTFEVRPQTYESSKMPFSLKPGNYTMKIKLQASVSPWGDVRNPNDIVFNIPVDVRPGPPDVSISPSTSVCASVPVNSPAACPMAITWSAWSLLHVTVQTINAPEQCSITVGGVQVSATPVILENLDRLDGFILKQDLNTFFKCSQPGNYSGQLLFRVSYP